MERTWPQALAACLPHDEAYERGGDERDRLIADLRFFIALLEHGVPPFVANQAFSAVRLFGGAYWNGDGGWVDVPAVVEIAPQTA